MISIHQSSHEVKTGCGDNVEPVESDGRADGIDEGAYIMMSALKWPVIITAAASLGGYGLYLLTR